MSILAQIVSNCKLELESDYSDIADLPSLPLSEKRNLPGVPAIYFCIAEDGEIVYIGRTINLGNRWAGHHKYSHLRTLKQIKIAWLQISDITLLNKLESVLIEHFKPRLNNLAYTGASSISLVDETEENFLTREIPPKEPTIRFTVDLAESIHRKLSILAVKTGRKKVEIVRFLVDQALEGLDLD